MLPCHYMIFLLNLETEQILCQFFKKNLIINTCLHKKKHKNNVLITVVHLTYLDPNSNGNCEEFCQFFQDAFLNKFHSICVSVKHNIKLNVIVKPNFVYM